MHLRTYQADIIEETRHLMRNGCKKVLIVAPCGSGKTILTAAMLKTSASKGISSLFIVHRKELLDNSIEKFADVGISPRVIASGYEEKNQSIIQIGSIQTLSRRIKRIKKPDFVIWDECHRIGARTWTDIYKLFPDAFHIGLSASPIRMDGVGLKDYFDAIVEGPSASQLIAENYLSPYKLYAPSNIDTSSLHTRMGDFVASEVSSLMDKPSITGDAIDHYTRLACDKRAVVFCSSIEHSKHVVGQFNAAGIAAVHVDGDSDRAYREKAMSDFKSGLIKILCNVDLFGEGVDVPAIEACILLRPTKSLGLYIQQTGRALRTHPGKDYAIILDHANNCLTHGLPSDERNWTLNGNSIKKRSQDEFGSVRVCPKCYAAQLSGSLTCAYCGFQAEPKPRKIDIKAGELAEVTAIKKTARREQGKAQTFEDLVAIGKTRRYANPYGWAKFVFNARQKKKLQEGGY